MIPRADIDRAFALCLRRPVDGDAAYDFFTTLPSLDAVYATLFDSPEFRGRIAPPDGAIGQSAQAIETEASPDALARMVAHVEATWTRLGETEPHWSVITDPRFTAAEIAQNRALYRTYGKLDEGRLGLAALRAGVDLGRLQHCFELGCGTGRVTEFLAQRFPRVLAADISRTHLAEAAVALEPLRHVTLLHLARLEDLAALPPFDMLYSRIVLQHNPPPVIAAILRTLLGRLAPGGVGYIQVPVWIPDYSFAVAPFLAGLQAGPMEMHALPQRVLLAIVQQAGCRLLDLREDALGPQFGGISNTVLVQQG